METEETKPVTNFDQLRIYQAALELQNAIFEVTVRFPKEETFSLTDQLRRSSRSIGANIAEAWQKRRYVAHFVSKLTDADGEQAETQHWLRTALDCRYLPDAQYEALRRECRAVGQMLGAMLAKAPSFCK